MAKLVHEVTTEDEAEGTLQALEQWPDSANRKKLENILRLWIAGLTELTSVSTVRKDGKATAILIHQSFGKSVDRCYVHCEDEHVLMDVEELLADFFARLSPQKTGVAPPKTRLIFPQLPAMFIRSVTKLASAHDFDLERELLVDRKLHFRSDRAQQTTSMSVPKEKIEAAPEGYTLKPVDELWSDFIYANWEATHKQMPESRDMIRLMLKTKLSQGIFDKKSGDLVAWYMMRDDGTQGLLYVQKNLRRKGLASLLVNQFRGTLKNLGLHEVVGILNENKPSRNFYAKHGFRSGEPFDWVYLVRRNKGGAIKPI